MTVPLRVLVLHHVTAVSGAERGLLDVVKALQGAGHEVEVGLPPEGELVDVLRDMGVPTHALPLARVYRTRNPVRLVRLAWRVMRARVAIRGIIRTTRIDVLHCNSDTAMLFGAAVASASGIPCVWHRRDLVDLGRIGALLGRQASRVLCISGCVAAASRHYVDTASKLSTLYNGISTEHLQPTRPWQAVRDELVIPADAIVVANIGQLIPWKQQDAFIAAAHAVAEELPGVYFLLLGSDLFDDHPDYVRSLQNAAKHGPAADRIQFVGYRHDMGDVLGATDIVVHAADREPFGRAVAEAMATGLPVVAAGSCGPAELIEDGVSGRLVTPGDVPGLVHAITELVRDPVLRERLGQAARDRVRSQFSMEAFAASMASVYNDIIHGAEPA